MRIGELNLEAYGPFSKKRIDLGGGDRGMHVIFGPNEAGKSSALRALRAALYGIPAQTPDNFLHAYGDLRVGATVYRTDGESLAFVRRKGRLNTLRTPDGEPMDPSALDSFLPVDEALKGCTRKHVEEERQFIRDLRGAILREFEKGTSFLEVPKTVKLPQYAHWAGYEDWLEMNTLRLMTDLWMGPFPWYPDAE